MRLKQNIIGHNKKIEHRNGLVVDYEMKVFKILFHPGIKPIPGTASNASEFGMCVGVVISQDGTLTPDQALSDWNAAQPSYQGDTAAEGPFLLK